ncbi:S8 family peptidase [Ferviditalea candida]|uniref:S8 family serine peptidase n=1 Tax=Ferviditalea candida TaxID=3108399 RepID=A0ABU5ZJU4_9BACL|nr:S8 family serine peptidase [Paenibacillaceae bacterium T2]
MNIHLKPAVISLVLAAVLLLGIAFPMQLTENPDQLQSSGFFPHSPMSASGSSWIVKWKNRINPEIEQASEVIRTEEAGKITVIQPKSGVAYKKWEALLAGSGQFVYAEPNKKIRIEETQDTPNNAAGTVPDFLRQIHQDKVKQFVTANRIITVAVVDTGVDLNHPAIAPYLIPGINLIDSSQPPQDDNGHGTNVAGVVAQVGNVKNGNNKWTTRIMPIKAIEADGQGDEEKLGQGIRYAVDHGAKIVVLSVGMNRNSPYIKDVAQYAEDHGAVLVSASGNENRSVKYPAAYPTVIAVGGVSTDNQVVRESNFGQELDVVAAWKVYTTALGGGYKYNQGTSMAAPQVAGVTALIWMKHPYMKPYQIRNMIRETAEDVESKGWDMYTGYGLIRADQAVSAKYVNDFYEPNDTKGQAKPLPEDTMITGELKPTTDADWYYLNSPYNGKVTFRMAGVDTPESNVNMMFFGDADSKGTLYENILSHPVVVPVKKGKSYVKFYLGDQTASSSVVYQLTTAFNIYKDPFEDNDRQYKAYLLPTKTQTVTGTFDHTGDQDWYMLDIAESGSLGITVSTDTARMDLALTFEKKDQKPIQIDWYKDGEEESIPPTDVLPGKYYLMIQNDISADSASPPVRGEYKLSIQFNKKYVDPNEPNDKPYQAVMMGMDSEYSGVLDQPKDVDWFMFKIGRDSLVNVNLNQIPSDRVMSLTLLDENQKQVAINLNNLGETRLSINQRLASGTYYIRLSADFPFQQQMYTLKVHSAALIAGYTDISGHWAEPSIVEMTKLQAVKGYPDYTFRPDNELTRAEAVTMIVKAFGITGKSAASYSDLPKTHWAYSYVGSADAAGIVQGYQDATFQPDRPISRMEMAVLIAKALHLKNKKADGIPFQDIAPDYWGIDILAQLKAKGWLTGYEDGTFHPKDSGSRAEFVSLLDRIIGNQ